MQSDRDQTDENWLKTLHEDIFDADLEIKSILAKKTMSLREIVKLEVGDIIPIDLPETAMMVAEGLPTFKVKLGQMDDNYALKIVAPVEKRKSNVEKPI